TELPSEPTVEEALAGLIGAGTLTHDSFRKAYTELMFISIIAVALWPAVEAKFHAATIENDPLVALQVMNVLLKFTRDIADIETIHKMLPGKFNVLPAPSFAAIVTSLSLKPEESFIISRFDGNKGITLDMLTALTGFPEEKIERFVYLLEILG